MRLRRYKSLAHDAANYNEKQKERFDCAPYAEYSKSIKKEADDIMTIAGMFEARGEARGIIKSGRIRSFSDSIIIEDIAEQTGCTLQEAAKFLHDFDQANLAVRT